MVKYTNKEKVKIMLDNSLSACDELERLIKKFNFVKGHNLSNEEIGKLEIAQSILSELSWNLMEKVHND